MRITKVSYGRTIVVGEGFNQEKIWFGWEAEVESKESADVVMAELHRMANDAERDQRDWHEGRTRERKRNR